MGVRTALERLKQIGPKSGRIIAENGEVANAADFMRTQNAVNDLAQAGLGRVFQSHKRVTLSSGETAYFRQNIAAGNTIRGVLGGASVIDGNVEGALVIGATAGNVIDTLIPFNADRREIDLQTPDLTNAIEQLDGFTGGVEIDPSVGYAANVSTSKAATTSLTGTGLGGIYDENIEPYFSYTNVGQAACDIIVRFIWTDITEILDHVR